MKSYYRFILIFVALLAVYIVAELNKPEPLDWKVTLLKDDKNPNGAYILYNHLPELFGGAEIVSRREPVYNLLHGRELRNAAYIILAPVFGAPETDVRELVQFAADGNYVFVSALRSSKAFYDTLGLERKAYAGILPGDSTSLNFVNPALRSATDYPYKRFTVDEYFSKLHKDDSTTVLGITNRNDPDFVKLSVGKGAIFVHAAPLAFSNYSMLSGNNYEYVAKAFSYIPEDVQTVYWDEYYTLGRAGARTPLRFFLGDTWLRWALWLTIVALVVYVLFEMKRRQRIIPVIAPLKNTTLDFVKTVSAVYLSQKDNRSIAANKLQYWAQFIRQRYFLQTNVTDDLFVAALARRSGSSEEDLRRILELSAEVNAGAGISDEMLLELNQRLEKFYTSSKI